jgi:hypothetical protein
MRKLAALTIAIAALGLATAQAMAGATPGKTYGWVVGFVPPGSSDTAIAPDGSTITMSGRGSLTTSAGGSVTGGGTYTKSSGGSGTWNATALLSFVSYGPSSIPGVVGGEANVRVTLSNGQTGVLTIFCVAPGTLPPAGTPAKDEGIHIILGSGVSDEYTMQHGGNTAFLGTS